MTHVMVTGGTGFVGHSVVLDLLEWTDWTLTIVDSNRHSVIPGKLTDDPRWDDSRVNMHSHNLVDPLRTIQLFPKPDMIFNIASNSHVDNSMVEPAPFIKENVALVVNMLEYASEVRPRLFIQFSTDEVYGAAPEGVNFKEWSTILPSNPYSASKAAQEAVAISYWRTFGVPLIITNTMNVIGPNQHPEKFVPKTVQHLLEGRPMPVHAQFVEDDGIPGGGVWQAGSRHYTYVSNISSALQFLSKITPAIYGTHGVDRPDRYNVVGDREVKNDLMVDMIADVLGVPSLKEYVDFHGTRPGHDRRYALDGSKLTELGWTPPYSFEEGLRRSVEGNS